MFALRCFLEPSIPMNEGCFRPLTFTLPLGTMVNPRPPAACNARMATVQAAIDAVFQALSQAVANKAVAASGNVHVYTMNGSDRSTGKIWSYMDAAMGSVGAPFDQGRAGRSTNQPVRRERPSQYGSIRN